MPFALKNNRSDAVRLYFRSTKTGNDTFAGMVRPGEQIAAEIPEYHFPVLKFEPPGEVKIYGPLRAPAADPVPCR